MCPLCVCVLNVLKRFSSVRAHLDLRVYLCTMQIVLIKSLIQIETYAYTNVKLFTVYNMGYSFGYVSSNWEIIPCFYNIMWNINPICGKECLNHLSCTKNGYK